jgi:4-hydroxy-tetrahydrodipicolinate synthase
LEAKLTTKHTPCGVFAAALTPLKADGSLDLDNVLPYLDFLNNRGCHGALLFGTTGEGPSFSPRERVELVKVAVGIKRTHPDFMLLMGTGTPSLDETIELTRSAFELGIQGVVVLPPYFNHKVSDEGLFAWYGAVLQKAVPRDGFMLGYHIPQMTGVPFSIQLLDRLKTAYPETFVGIKNSWTEKEFALTVGDHFGPDFTVMAGFDNLFGPTLEKHGSGCITASATLVSPLLRKLYDAFQAGGEYASIQAELERIRTIMDTCPPAPALIKGLLARWHNLPLWNVSPPLCPTDLVALDRVAEALNGPF